MWYLNRIKHGKNDWKIPKLKHCFTCVKNVYLKQYYNVNEDGDLNWAASKSFPVILPVAGHKVQQAVWQRTV